MTDSSTDNIILFSSRWCPQSLSVERFLKRNNVIVEKIDVDSNAEAREELIRLNNGYASVPTLLFQDGTKLTEPSFTEIRKKLNLASSPSLVKRIRDVFSQEGSSD